MPLRTPSSQAGFMNFSSDKLLHLGLKKIQTRKMEIADRIKAYLIKDDYKSKSPEGFCPNCWGRQEYSGKFFEALKKSKY